VTLRSRVVQLGPLIGDDGVAVRQLTANLLRLVLAARRSLLLNPAVVTRRPLNDGGKAKRCHTPSRGAQTGGCSFPCHGPLSPWANTHTYIHTYIHMAALQNRIGHRAALRLVRARVLCQMRAPYRPITAHKNFPLPPIAGPKNCGPGCCSTPSTALMRHWQDRPLYFWPVVSIFFVFYLFSLPNLSGPGLDVCHTSTHGVALVRI